VTAFMSTLQAVHGTAPDPPCGEFDIEAVAEDGTRRRVPLASATRIPLADMTPARRIKARKGQRNLPGRWWSATDGRHVGYESWLERDQVMWLDWDQTVTGIASQPFRLWWTAREGKTLPGWITAAVIQPGRPGGRPPALYPSVRDRNAL
jgi:hypothetical protein